MNANDSTTLAMRQNPELPFLIVTRSPNYAKKYKFFGKMVLKK